MCLSTVYRNEVSDANMLAKNVADVIRYQALVHVHGLLTVKMKSIAAITKNIIA